MTSMRIPYRSSIRQTAPQSARTQSGLGSLFGRMNIPPQMFASQRPVPFSGGNISFVRGGPQFEVPKLINDIRDSGTIRGGGPQFEVPKLINDIRDSGTIRGGGQSVAPQRERAALTEAEANANPFEGSDAYRDYERSQNQQQKMQSAFESQQRQFNPINPRMGMGLGGMRPMGMQPYQGFGRPQFPMMQPRMPQFGAMGYNQPQQQYMSPYQQPQYQPQQYMNPYQQMRPQPQQFGGYGIGQQMGGYGNYGQMPNPYQPQQMGYNTNNYGGYGQNQFQGYGQQQRMVY